MRTGTPSLTATLPLLAVLGGATLGAPPAAAQSEPFSAKVTDDRPDAASCVEPVGLPPDAPDVNNQPQAEVWIDVAEDGRLAAVAKDYRFSPIDDTTYNNRVWNGLYLSDDGGASWTNRGFEEQTPDGGLAGATDGAYGQPAGVQIRLTHETDPVSAFDRDGNLYTCALAFQPGVSGDPSALVVSRWDATGRLVAGSTRLIALENDPQLFNDKNWLAVGRDTPRDSTVVVASWRLFVTGTDAAAEEGGYVAVSGDGAATFSAPIRLPVPAAEAAASQFYQPLIGRDPATGRRALYVGFTTQDDFGRGLALHYVRADIDGVVGTAALAERLADPLSWIWMPARLDGLSGYGANGYDGSFRFGSFFLPALDPDTGILYAVVHVFDPASRRSRVMVTRSGNGAATWSPLQLVDDPGRGYQLMPALAARGGRVFAVWYDSRNDPEFATLAPIHGLDVYAAELDDGLGVLRVHRLTPETQRADRPVFTRARGAQAAGFGRTPHERPPVAPLPIGPHESGVQAMQAQSCADEQYGFIGDYIGIAAGPDAAYAVWTDLRDMTEDAGGVCEGHSCSGNRNQNVRFARIPRQ